MMLEQLLLDLAEHTRYLEVHCLREGRWRARVGKHRATAPTPLEALQAAELAWRDAHG